MKTVKNQNDKSMKYVESKILRDETINNVSYDFLDKMKVVPYLTNDMVISTSQAANYYECGLEAIKTIIKRNRAEFENDGMIVLKGKDLKAFKKEIGEVQSEPTLTYASSLTILPKRSLLRIGMILTNNELATKVRNYLLNIEEKTDFDRKSWAIQREVGIIERKRMTSAIAKYIPNTRHKQFAYPNYTNMIYKILFQKTAKELREERKCKTNDALRDTFSECELKQVEEVETIVTGLISMDFTYKQIEEMLRSRYLKRIV